jgi:Fimbrial assembly protein (PilN)
MHELDLIPASYREWLKVKGWFRLFAAAVAVVIPCIVGLKLVIANSTKVVSEKIEVLQKNKVTNLGLQKKYNDLVAEEVKLKKDLEVLQGLQGGPSAKQMLLAIDRAMQTGVWFTQWSFNRAREITPVQPATTQNGYFIVIPPEDTNAPATGQQAWRLTAHMEISGQALDHTNFSNLVNNLIKQPEIDDVKVINTSLRSFQNAQVVDFKIVVVINNNFKGGDV